MRMRGGIGAPLGMIGAALLAGPTALVDLRLGYAVTDALSARVDLYNTLDSHADQIDYYYLSQLPGEPRPVADIHFHPVEPISARFTLAYSF